MDNVKINEVVSEIRMKEKAIKDINVEIDAMKNLLKDELKARNVDEIDTGVAKVSWKDETRMNFDSKKFKAEHLDLYESYAKEKVVKKFLVK